tara:strand:- start:1022 stop:2251 length:1230 start_codon:yes stop_codon:yes gene_type:complete
MSCKPSPYKTAPANIPGIAPRGWEWLLDNWLSRIEVGKLTVTFPSGFEKTFGGHVDGPSAKIDIYSWRLIPRLLLSGDIGLAESFMNGEWDTSDLSQLILLGDMNERALGDAVTPSTIVSFLERLRHGRRTNSKRGSKRNIAAHYDLGNNFYAEWLDNSMSYSSAIFDNEDEGLELAQRRKYLRLAKKLGLKEGETVLEIGCGWGGFAEIAAQEFKCKVVGVTLSTEQATYAKARMQDAEVSNLVEIRVQDYRDIRGHFDKIVSIEMFEAVGAKHWRNYFKLLKNRLNMEGKAAVQCITIADSFFEVYKRRPDFIQKYIFPGGILPSESALNRSINDAGLAVLESHYFGKSYAETLRRWHINFEERWSQIKKLGFDEQFKRMWRYYLSYCEAGFETGHINVGQFIISSR